MLSFINSGKGVYLPPKGILVVGRQLVSHFAIFTLVSFTIDSSMVEVLIESCLI